MDSGNGVSLAATRFYSKTTGAPVCPCFSTFWKSLSSAPILDLNRFWSNDDLCGSDEFL
jgi:hypothetical protein